MKKIRQYHFISLTIILPVLFSSFTHNNLKQTHKVEATLKIHFSALAGHSPLVTGKTISNSFHESFTIDRFRFYVGEFKFLPENKHSMAGSESDNYFLFDLTDPASADVNLPLSEGTYEGIEFLLGVDSVHSASGAQTGALDPRMGMFWTWNSGFVMLKLEGISPLSNLPGHLIEYHIGGYKKPYNVCQHISLLFPKGKEIKIVGGQKNQVGISVDINKLFDGSYPVHISDIPACNSPGQLAKGIADNCKQMFSLEISTGAP